MGFGHEPNCSSLWLFVTSTFNCKKWRGDDGNSRRIKFTHTAIAFVPIASILQISQEYTIIIPSFIVHSELSSVISHEGDTLFWAFKNSRLQTILGDALGSGSSYEFTSWSTFVSIPWYHRHESNAWAIHKMKPSVIISSCELRRLINTKYAEDGIHCVFNLQSRTFHDVIFLFTTRWDHRWMNTARSWKW